MNIVVFGPPGVGKGTSSELLAKALKIPKISTGDMLRDEMARKTPLGVKVAGIINAGNLVPDDMIIEFFKNRIGKADCKRGFITDGFPRTVAQAEALKRLCTVHFAFNLKAKQSSVLKRITGRRLCGKCGSSYNVNISYFKPKKKDTCDSCGSALIARADQEPTVVKQRLKVYDAQTKPLIAFYKDQGSLHTIDAEGKPDSIVSAMLGIVRGE